MARSSFPDIHGAWLRGAAAGAAGAVPAAALVGAASATAGLGALTPAFAAASALYRSPPPHTAGVALAGLLLHLAVSAVLGAAWTGLVGRYLRPAAATVGGASAGLGAWLLSTWLLLPVAAPALRALADHFPGAWLAAHLAWGMVLGWTADALEPPDLLRAAPPFTRWFRRARRARA
jgi:hypothetical protein